MDATSKKSLAVAGDFSFVRKDSLRLFTSSLFTIHCPKGPSPIQLVVVIAVKNAVSAATITFTATSTILFFIPNTLGRIFKTNGDGSFLFDKQLRTVPICLFPTV